MTSAFLLIGGIAISLWALTMDRSPGSSPANVVVASLGVLCVLLSWVVA